MVRLVDVVLVVMWCITRDCWFLFFSCTSKAVVVLLGIIECWFNGMFVVLVRLNIVIMVIMMVKLAINLMMSILKMRLSMMVR